MKNTIFYRDNKNTYRDAVLKIIRSGKSAEKIRNILEEYHDNDIANAIIELSESERITLLSVLGHKTMARIISHLEDADIILEGLPVADAAAIIEQMEADEAIDALEYVDEEKKAEIMHLISDAEIKEDISLLDSYGEDEFGSRMSTNFISVRKDSSVKEATRTLIEKAAENDNIFTLFATDRKGSFCGAINLKDLITARSTDSLSDLITERFPFVYDKDSISENISSLRGYSEELIPVLSFPDRRLLGVISFQDITDMIDEELSDDYAKLAALSGEEEHNESLIKSMKKRIPWLIALLFLGLTVSAVVGAFEGVVNELPAIVAFQSLILGMAGNVGTQSLAVTVRILGTEPEFNLKKQFGLIGKETRIAFLNGAVIALISFLTVILYLSVFGSHTFTSVLSIGGCVAAAMCFSMMISGFTGTAIPITLYRFGIDPAVASGPLITTVNDLAAVVSYYGLAFILLLKFK